MWTELWVTCAQIHQMLYLFLRRPQNLVAIDLKMGKKRAGRYARQIGSSDPRETSQLNLTGPSGPVFYDNGPCTPPRAFPWTTVAAERRRPRRAATRGQTGSAAVFAEGFTIPKAGRWGCPHARARRRRSHLAGGDQAAATAFYLLDVAGAAESEGPADDVMVVKSQQAQQLTKDLVKTIAAHGFSALGKRHARVPGRRAHARRCAIR